MFKNYINNLENNVSFFVNAGRKEEVREKYPLVSRETVEFFIKNAPNNNLKYLNWQCKILNAKQALKEEINDVIQLFYKYNSQLEKKDINQYEVSDFTNLRDKLFEIKEKSDFKRGKDKDKYQLDTACEYEVVYESENYKVLLIKNKAAAVHFGHDSKWCISMKNQAYFENYDSNNVVFFYILFEGDKIAVAVQRDINNEIISEDWYNSSDQIIDPPTDNEINEIASIIKSKSKAQPKSLLAKLSSKEISQEELEKLYNDAKKNSDQNYKTNIYTKIINLNDSSDFAVEILNKIYNDIGSSFKSFDVDLIEAICSNKNANPYILKLTFEAIKKEKNDYVKALPALAENLQTPIEILTELFKSYNEHFSIKWRILRNPNVTENLLEILSKDEESSIRHAVAMHSTTSPDTLKELSKEDDLTSTVIRNPNVTTDLLEILSRDKRDFIRHEVAININTPANILKELSKDENPEIRMDVAENRVTPYEILIELSKDEIPEIRMAVERKLNRRKDYEEYESQKTAADNPSTRPLEPFYTNYDYIDQTPGQREKDRSGPGGGLYHGKMDKYKSVKDFINKDRKRKRKKRKLALLLIGGKIV